MGLDTYLNIRYAIKEHSSDDPQIRERYEKMKNLLGHKLSVVEWKGMSWRGAYSINEWFLRNVSDQDSFEVSLDHLERLLEICRQIVDTNSGQDQLPKSSLVSEEEYREEIKYTFEKLPTVLKNVNDYCEFRYSMSY